VTSGKAQPSYTLAPSNETMNRRAFVAIAFAALFSVGALAFLVQTDSDSFTSSPSLTIEYTVWQVEYSLYPTASWESHTFVLTNPNVYTSSEVPKPLGFRPSDLLSLVVDGIKSFLSFDWLVGSARATGADTHYLVADAACTTTAISTDADCWSHNSGGAGGAGVLGTGNTAALDAGSGAGTFAPDAAMNVGVWNMTGFTGTLNMGTNTLTVNGNLTLAGTFNGNTSTVVFAASGTLTMTANNIDRAMYNMTINAGVTVTNATNGAWVSNLLTVNGILVAGGAEPSQQVFNVSGGSVTTPVVIGAGGDLDSSGYFIYRLRGPCGTTYTIAGGLYQHPAILAGNSTCAYTANLGGNISSPLCASYRDCALLVSSEATLTPAAQFTFNTQNYGISMGGILWVGDGGTTGATANFGSSSVEAYGVAPSGDNVVVNWQSSTVIAHMTDGLSPPLCHLTSYSVQEYFNTSNWTCHGEFRLGSGSTGVNAFWDFGSATITITDNETGTGGGHFPGNFNFVRSDNYVLMGSSTVTVEDRWTNNTTDARWDAGTSTVKLLWDFSNANGTDADAGHYFVGGAGLLAEPEFYNLEFSAIGAGARRVELVNTDPPWGPVWVANRLRVYDSDGGTVEVDTQGFNVTSDEVVLEANATLTVSTGDILNLTFFKLDGGLLSQNGVSVGTVGFPFQFTSTGGDIDIPTWTTWSVTDPLPNDIQWSFSGASASSLTVTVLMSDVTQSTKYLLLRDGSEIAEDKDGDASATFSKADGWSGTQVMRIQNDELPPPTGDGPPVVSKPPPWGILFVLSSAFALYVYHLKLQKRRRRR